MPKAMSVRIQILGDRLRAAIVDNLGELPHQLTSGVDSEKMSLQLIEPNAWRDFWFNGPWNDWWNSVRGQFDLS